MRITVPVPPAITNSWADSTILVSNHLICHTQVADQY
jgi:hypothetical protein